MPDLGRMRGARATLVIAFVVAWLNFFLMAIRAPRTAE
jgi:hypothetical protein